jgi:hypothetical protein
MIELYPSGISVQSTMGRPLLILKDKSQSDVMPVWMHPLDAGVALAEMSEGSGLTPHGVTRKILALVDLKVESCTFSELVGHHQFVTLTFIKASAETDPPLQEKKTLHLRADEAMSFCLQSKARFYATREYMARCRNLNVELGQLEEGLQNGALQALQSELENSSKNQPYMM